MGFPNTPSRLMPVYRGKIMGKNTRIASISAIVLLYTISFSGNAQAGFFDWLASQEGPVTLLTDMPKENSISTDNSDSDLRAIFEKDAKDAEKPKTSFKVIREHIVQASGYSSTPDQTDSTPFITASGEHVRDGIIAANVYVNGQRLPFGTLVRIPDIYGDKVFIVEDRMNIRYRNNIDIWFPERQSALEFGIKQIRIEIVS